MDFVRSDVVMEVRILKEVLRDANTLGIYRRNNTMSEIYIKKNSRKRSHGEHSLDCLSKRDSIPQRTVGWTEELLSLSQSLRCCKLTLLAKQDGRMVI